MLLLLRNTRVFGFHWIDAFLLDGGDLVMLPHGSSSGPMIVGTVSRAETAPRVSAGLYSAAHVYIIRKTSTDFMQINGVR